jgi:hypothetical protein
VLTPDGKPVPGAKVYWLNPNSEPAVTTTDTNGVYHFPNDEGLCVFVDLLVDAPGWAATPWYFEPVNGTPPGFTGLSHHAGGDDPPTSPDVRLLPAGKLELTFRDEAGKPVVNTLVAVEAFTTPRLYGWCYLPKQLQQRFSADSGDDGRCTISGLPRGAELHLCLKDPHFAALTYEQYAITLGDDGSVTKAPPITLLPAASIQGTICYSLTNKPAAGIRIYAWGSNGFVDVTSDVEGRFTVDSLRPDTYTIGAFLSVEQHEEWAVAPRRHIVVTKGAKLIGMDLTLTKGALITGTVVAADDSSPLPRLRITAKMKDGEEKNNGLTVFTAEKDGSYRLRVPPGAYQLSIEGDVPGFMKQEPAACPFTTVKEGDTITCDFKLVRSKVKPIHGVVFDPDGKPAAGADVYYMPLISDPPRFPDSIKTNAKGEFTLEALPVSVSARLGDCITVKELPLPEGGEITLRLAAGLLCTITGQVVDANGKPLPGAEVAIDGWLTQDRIVVKDKDGRYKFTGLWPGYSYYLAADALGYGSDCIDSTVPEAGQLAAVDKMHLNKLDSFIAGKLVNEAGHPLVGAQVQAYSDRMYFQKTTTDNKGAFRLPVFKGDEVCIMWMDSGWKQTTIKASGQTNLVIISKEKKE